MAVQNLEFVLNACLGTALRLLTENFKSHNSFLWRQLTASGPSPNTLFLSPGCPQKYLHPYDQAELFPAVILRFYLDTILAATRITSTNSCLFGKVLLNDDFRSKISHPRLDTPSQSRKWSQVWTQACANYRRRWHLKSHKLRGELSWEGTAKIRAILSNMHGALLEKQIDGFRTWNLDELRLLKRKRSQPMKPKAF